MARPQHPMLDTCLALIKYDGMTATEAGKLHGVSKSSISHALKRKYCPTCNHLLRRKSK